MRVLHVRALGISVSVSVLFGHCVGDVGRAAFGFIGLNQIPQIESLCCKHDCRLAIHYLLRPLPL